MRNLIEKQPHYNAKRWFAGILAFLTLGGGVAAGGITLKHRNKNGANAKPAIVQEENTEDFVTEDDVKFESNLFLDFDINDNVAVQKRAEDIFNLLSKDRQEEFSKADIVNLIYLVNGEYKKIDFGSAVSDAEKYRFLQNLILKIERLLGNNVPGYVNLLAGNQEKAEGEFVHSAYLMATNTDGKKLAIEFANVINEQKENIINKKSEKEKKATADKYISLVDKILKAIKDGQLTAAEATLITKDEKAKNGMFTTWLKNYTEYNDIVVELDKNLVSNTNKLGNEAVADLGLQAAVEDLEKNFKQTPVGDSYNAADAAAAQAMVGGNSGKKEVDAGGAQVGTEQQVVSGGDVIGTESHTEIVNVGGQESHTEIVEEGGEIVDEIIYEEVVDLPPEIIEEIIGGEVIEEGGEVVEEYYYADSDEADYSLVYSK